MLITSQKKKHLFLIRSAKFRERIEASVSSSQRASKYALQKADIAVSRTATARGKAEMADTVAENARIDSEIAVATAREFAPDFKPSVLDRLERIRVRDRFRPPSAEPMTHLRALPGQQNHVELPAEQRATVHQSGEATPQKQSPFPQTTLRRSSMLQKQASVDFPSTSAQGGNAPDQYQPPSGSSYHNSMNPGHKTMYDPYQNAQQQHHQQQMSPSSQQQYMQQSNPQNYTNPEQNYANQNYSYSHQMSQQTYVDQYGNNPQQNQHNYNPMTSNQNQYGQSSISQNQPQVYSGGGAYQSTNHPNQQPANQSYPNSVGINNQMNPNDTSYNESQQQQDGPSGSNLRRNSRPLNENSRPPHLGQTAQTSIDYFDHYKRPPSRDSSVDRYARAATRLSGSRQPSVDRTVNNPNNQVNDQTAPFDRNTRAGSAFRTVGSTGNPTSATGNGSVMTGMRTSPRLSNTPAVGGVAGSSSASHAIYSSPNQPFEDVLLRQRTLGQDIIPSPREPKRTESLYLPPKVNPAPATGNPTKGKLKVSKTMRPIDTSYSYNFVFPLKFIEIPWPLTRSIFLRSKNMTVV